MMILLISPIITNFALSERTLRIGQMGYTHGLPVQNAHNDTRYRWSKRYYPPHCSVYLIDNNAPEKLQTMLVAPPTKQPND